MTESDFDTTAEEVREVFAWIGDSIEPNAAAAFDRWFAPYAGAVEAVQRVRRLHAMTEQPDPNDIFGVKTLRICDACDESVPCSTIEALDDLGPLR